MSQSQQRSKGGISSPQRMSVRLALATSATVAVLLGAQALASTGRANASALNNTVSSSSIYQGNARSGDDNNYDYSGQTDQSFQFGNPSFQSPLQAAPDQPNPFTRSSR